MWEPNMSEGEKTSHGQTLLPSPKFDGFAFASAIFRLGLKASLHRL
uniref:Uncharacterized protein n=1 Tax=Nelumbo nucifera TaxID=4432 RepID=A0A822XG11_NELNU|nr:TPA_asm: hypothetical protein HUJ06_020305 [Nelumbo nucifera]